MLQWRFVLAVLATGVVAGVAGTALTLLLHGVQHLAFGYTENTFLIGVEHASSPRRVLAVGIGGAIAGTGWWLHRRSLRKRDAENSISVTHALTRLVPRLPITSTVTDAVFQIVAVGAGASLGREGAPRQVGAAGGGVIGEWLGLSREQRRLLLAAGAGGGLAAVYNVPFGGAAFAVEVLLATAAPTAVLSSLVVCWIASVVAWPVLGNDSTYQLPHLSLTAGAVAAVTVAAALLGLVLGPFGMAFRALMTRARTHATTGWRTPIAVTITFLALGATAIAYPQLLGNGKSLTQYDLGAVHTIGMLAALSLLKPLATAACLRAGAIGGLLTPSFATGATLGLLAGHLWTNLWPASPIPALAVLGAAGLLAVTQRAPITAVVLTAEFTHAPLLLLPAIAVSVASSSLTAHGAGRLARRHEFA